MPDIRFIRQLREGGPFIALPGSFISFGRPSLNTISELKRPRRRSMSVGTRARPSKWIPIGP